MDAKKEKRIRIGTLAFGIAFMPPIWAVLSPYIGVTTGAVALICAGLYVANGNKRSDAFKIAAGFLCGDVWAVLAVWIMETLQFNPDVELYCTLFILGGFAVLIGENVPKYIFTPSWLCGCCLLYTSGCSPSKFCIFNPLESTIADIVARYPLSSIYFTT